MTDKEKLLLAPGETPDGVVGIDGGDDVAVSYYTIAFSMPVANVDVQAQRRIGYTLAEEDLREFFRNGPHLDEGDIWAAIDRGEHVGFARRNKGAK